METLEKQNLDNRISKIYPEQASWISEEINKKKFMYTRGREVLIDAPGRNLKKIVSIPSKNDSSYIIAWINVYNYCLDYLEGSINAACLENKFIQRMGNSWTLDGKIIVWPKFTPKNADYAVGLERILDRYNEVKARYIKKHARTDEGVSVNKTTIHILPPNEVKENISEIKPSTSRKDKNYIKNLNVKYSSLDSDNKKVFYDKPDYLSDTLRIQKISDGDILTGKDVRHLRECSDIVLLTCMNVLNPKEEDIFAKNGHRCKEAGISVGAFFYGLSSDGKEASQELKIMFKILNNIGDNFSGLVIYSVNNHYIMKNKDSDIKLLDFVNMYNFIASSLEKFGYTVLISMNIECKKIIDDINRRYNMISEYPMIYVAVVRDIERLDDNLSKIVIDPWNDYDSVDIKEEAILKKITKEKERS